MAISQFPPAGGGGGAAPLPGATTSVVQGKFLISASVATTLEAGAYVGTVLQSTSGTSKLDVKKNTSGSVGVLEAGKVTIDTVVQTENGFTLFSQFVKKGLLPSVQVSNNYINDPGWTELQNYGNEIRKHFTSPDGQNFLFTAQSAQSTSGVYMSGNFAWELDAAGNAFGLDINENSSNNNTSSWKRWGNPCYHSSGKVWVGMSGNFYTNHDSPKYWELSANGWNSQGNISTGGAMWDSVDMNVFYQYGSSYFTNDGTDFYKATSIPTSSWSNVTSALPGGNIDYIFNVSKIPLSGKYVIIGYRGYAVVEADLSSYVFYDWLTVTNNKADQIFDAHFNGTYWVISITNDDWLYYTTDPTNPSWSVRSDFAGGSTIRSITYDTTNNRYLLGVSGGKILRGSGSSPGDTYDTFTPGIDNYITFNKAHGWVIDRYTGNYNVIRQSANGGSSFSDYPLPRPMYKMGVVDNGVDTALVYGYYQPDSNEPMIVRTTDGTTFTEVTVPFSTGYVPQIAWDDTLNLFVMTQRLDLQVFTSPDGITWTDRGVSDLNTVYHSQFSRYGFFADGGEFLSASYDQAQPVKMLADYINSNEVTNPIPGLTRGLPTVMQSIELGADTYIVTSSGIIGKQTSETPTFETYSTTPSGSSSSDSYVPMMYLNNKWHFFAQSGGIYHTTDLITWTATGPANATSIAYLGGKVYYTSPQGFAVSSDDGATWQSIEYTDVRADDNMKALFAKNNKLVSGFISSDNWLEYQDMDGQAEIGVVYYASDLEDI